MEIYYGKRPDIIQIAFTFWKMENEPGKWKIAFVKLISSNGKTHKKIISYCYNLEICMLYEFPCSQGHWNSVNPSPYLNPGWILGAQTRRHLGFLEFSVRCCQEASIG